jgi:hypothetical protein
MKRKRHKRKYVCLYRSTNAVHVIIKKIFKGNEKQFFDWMLQNTHVEMYNNEVGVISCHASTPFDMNGWKDEISDQRVRDGRRYAYSKRFE